MNSKLTKAQKEAVTALKEVGHEPFANKAAELWKRNMIVSLHGTSFNSDIDRLISDGNMDVK